jgi:hypothetical protein
MAFKTMQQTGVDILHPMTPQIVIEKECTGHEVLSCAKAGHKSDFVLISESFGAHIISGKQVCCVSA